MDASKIMVWGYGRMNTYVVDGNTQIGWSVTIQASSAEEAAEKAKEHWQYNTTYEDVLVHAVFNDTTGESE